MKALETSKDKIKKICDILKNESLEPAKAEAQKIIEEAEQEAQQIIQEAEAKAREFANAAEAKMKREKQLFMSSLEAASRNGLEALRQDIEGKLFNKALSSWLEQQTSDPDVGAKLIRVLIEAIEKEGTSADFSALIPKNISVEKINALLTKKIIEKLREKSVIVGEFIGGVELKLHDRQLTLDLSEQALKELIGNYIRKDFRELLFQVRM